MARDKKVRTDKVQEPGELKAFDLLKYGVNEAFIDHDYPQLWFWVQHHMSCSFWKPQFLSSSKRPRSMGLIGDKATSTYARASGVLWTCFDVRRGLAHYIRLHQL